MSDTITLDIDGAEAHVLEAALAIYRGQLTDAKALGGPALEAACLMDGPAARIQSRLHDALYGKGDPPEPEWGPESADPITLAKAADDYWRGDHHIYERDEDTVNLEGMPEFNGAFR